MKKKIQSLTTILVEKDEKIADLQDELKAQKEIYNMCEQNLFKKEKEVERLSLALSENQNDKESDDNCFFGDNQPIHNHVHLSHHSHVDVPATNHYS